MRCTRRLFSRRHASGQFHRRRRWAHRRVDFGIMGRIGRKERRFLAEILYGFIRRDYRRVAEVHFEAGYVSSIHRVEDFAQAIRAVGEPIHARTADQISMAKLLTLLFEVTALFDMKTRLELVMLQKTMVVVEGVARKLDPHLDMWATAEPVVAGWISENLGPRGRARSRPQPSGGGIRRSTDRSRLRRCWSAWRVGSTRRIRSASARAHRTAPSGTRNPTCAMGNFCRACVSYISSWLSSGKDKKILSTLERSARLGRCRTVEPSYVG